MNAHAHTGLESSIPQANETIDPIDRIVLNFESNIEEQASLRVYPLRSSSPLRGSFSREERTMQMSWERPLTSGLYRVDWKIIGTDGHPIEGTYSFTVASKKSTADQVSDSLTKKEVKTEQKNTRATRDESIFPFLITGVLLVLGVYSFYRIVLRGRRR